MAVTSAHAQGRVIIDNYNTYGPYVTYGAGANQIAGTSAGTPIHNGANGTAGTINWTMGIYYALGDVTATVGSDSSGFGTSSFNGLTLATGQGSSTANLHGGADAGSFSSVDSYIIQGYTAGPVTLETIVYSGADYASSLFRGHSAAYTTTPATGIVTSTTTGTGMSAFGVFAVPEPSTFALAGLGAAALLAFRRKKQA